MRCLCEGAPVMRDSRLVMTLFASDPDIVTPIGMAIDRKDRVFVVESHTHLAPAGYKGPNSDRIKVFVDEDHDGKPDKISVFAEGIREALNLAFSPQGELFVVCAREVWALPDANGDGVCDEKERRRVLAVETSNLYPHSCLLGITFSPDGRLYVSRGNNGSAAYTIRSAKGEKLSGYGDGGNVIRCRPDGSKLEEFATGFWNPFDLSFDHAGRLLMVDNDPDARGPNRFLHVVRGGDYGYKSLYGGGGNSPLQGWEGELPGTLPMIDGTGEAPSGLLECSRAAFPGDYKDGYLVTIWNENSIAHYTTRDRGVSLTATHSNLVTGSTDFRPVALQADSKGDVYVTDWMLVDYSNHGRGRIWKISAKAKSPGWKPEAPSDPAEPVRLLDALMALDRTNDIPRLKEALNDGDPFIRHGAVVALSRPVFREAMTSELTNQNPRLRMGAMLALKRSGYSNPQMALRNALRDPDPEVCRAALLWTAESMLTELRSDIDVVLKRPDLSATLFETWLATAQNLDPKFISAFHGRSKDKASQPPRTFDPTFIDGLIRDSRRSTEVRVLAMRRMANPAAPEHEALLTDLSRGSNERLAREAIRTLGQAATQSAGRPLAQLALDIQQPPAMRAEALAALSWTPELDTFVFLSLLDDPDLEVRVEAARLLGRDVAKSPVRVAFTKDLDIARPRVSEVAFAQQLENALNPPSSDVSETTLPRPRTAQEWQGTLSYGGNAAAGERLFYTATPGCAKCHTIENRGGRLGPDLSHISKSASRAQIIQSILRPSEQFAPQWQAWFVETKDGETHEGLQLDHKDHGAIELFTTAGKVERFEAKNIANYGARQNSLMPDGLEFAMTVEDFRNLAAFLETLK